MFDVTESWDEKDIESLTTKLVKFVGINSDSAIVITYALLQAALIIGKEKEKESGRNFLDFTQEAWMEVMLFQDEYLACRGSGIDREKHLKLVQ